MRVLVACEESQVVTKAFREIGHEAFSCDLQECSGGFPQWHIKADVLEILNDEWDLMIAHPPCTHLAVSGAKWFETKMVEQRLAIYFFLAIANAPIERICIENPVGIMSTFWRKPDQIIQPYFFGDEAQKTTCLWLKNLPKLVHHKQTDMFSNATHVGKGEFIITGGGNKLPKWYSDAKKSNKEVTQKLRSKTFDGIAKAMAVQWG